MTIQSMLGTDPQPIALPLAFLDPEKERAFADFRRDQDIPDDAPLSPQMWEQFEDWLRDFDDPVGLHEYEQWQRECAAEWQDIERPSYKPGHDSDFPF